jgi:SAM-dependent methyltransferase
VHRSAYEHMKMAMARHLPKDRRLEVLELGSARVANQPLDHRSLLAEVDHSYIGVDIREADNVDVVMKKPYTIPARSNSKDVVIAGQVFEHIPFFWASMLEVARILRPGGVWFVTVPSRGHRHGGVDCWRYYRGGMRAIAAASRLTLLETHTHFPPTLDGSIRHDYAKTDSQMHYWGDTLGVFQKPQRYPLEMRVVAPVVRWWANRSAADGPLGGPPKFDPKCPL